MTVFIDSREDIKLTGASKVENLEQWSGADLMLSRLTMPCKTRALLDKHIDAGAILVQLKVGEDLAASVGDRLNDSLARMRSVTKRTASHWLLFIGVLGCDKEGSATINGYRSRGSLSFATIDGAIVGWMARGGVYYTLPRIEMLDAWCHAMERRLAAYDAHQYHYAFSQQDMPDDFDTPLQIPVRVTDARRVLIGFKGLGPETVNKVWKHCGDFKAALMFLTDPSSAGVIEGIGAKTIASIRRQCGLSESDGYFGWDRDTPEPMSVKEIIAATHRIRTQAEIDRDTADLFGKKAKATT